jgi:copper chaperone CopZ
MRKLLFKVEDKVCDECALALERFLGHLEGIVSVAIEDRRISVVFDDAKMTDEDLIKLTTDNLEKLGHRLTEHWHFA